ncbi:MAG: alpha/beta hydrolase [Prochlorococcaceae cyanobacterium ETNP7_MAG_30]|nr:alpha/beta hydrolase [Prochlorococcaceae cyanobacterium ETNP7_MAG_30]
MVFGRAKVQKTAIALLGSLLLAASGVLPLNAAKRLEVQLDGMVIPVLIEELLDWGSAGGTSRSELTTWLNLLDAESQLDLLELLQAPLLTQQSMARQMLRSWAGRQLLDEFSDLLRVGDDSSGIVVLNTLESLLNNQAEVSTLDLLKALPAESIRLDLDALLRVASRWRSQLQQQQQLAKTLGRLSATSVPAPKELTHEQAHGAAPELISLSVPHRSEPLPLEVWPPSVGTPLRSSLVVLMPGLGGSKDHFRWLAQSLGSKGWPVVVLEHPGSDARAVQDLLTGRRLPPGAEVLPERLADLQAVLRAHKEGKFASSSQRLVLMGHSLGALTALLAAGDIPEPGLHLRCHKALEDIPLTNLSSLLQCQLTDVQIPVQPLVPQLEAIVALNSFGSLLWPSYGDLDIPVPVLLAGGTLDLITPPLSEQLDLLLATQPHPASRAVLVEGASHFSPVRVEAQKVEGPSDDLFKLGKELVGLQPLTVQRLLAVEIQIFLEQVEAGEGLKDSVHKQIGDLRVHRLDRAAVERLRDAQ